MNNFDKLDILGGIDPKYIEKASADPAVYRRRLKRTLISAAACLCLVALGLTIGGISAGKQQTTAADNVNTQINTQASNENAQIITGGQDQPSSTDNSTLPVFNGAQIPGEDPGNTASNGAKIPGGDPDDTRSDTPVRLISSYKEPSYDADLTVENGMVVLSGSLEAAINEYKDSATPMPGDTKPRETVFRVEVIFFKDGKKLPNDSPEASAEEKRLIIEGYTVATEGLIYEGKLEQILWTLHATAGQLLDFKARPDMGYYIVLYDEYTGIKSETDAVFNGTNAPN